LLIEVRREYLQIRDRGCLLRYECSWTYAVGSGPANPRSAQGLIFPLLRGLANEPRAGNPAKLA
jgi:hypothetical protein